MLSIGSSADQDKEGRTYRDYFPLATVYHTSEPKPGCDLVLDVRAMPQVLNGSYNAILCGGVLEHVDAKEWAVSECHRVLAQGGLFLVGVPFAQEIHRAPQDFWRFTKYGLQHLLRAFEIDELVTIGPELNPSAYWVKARKA